jgi:hypothetical protein
MPDNADYLALRHGRLRGLRDRMDGDRVHLDQDDQQKTESN